MARSLSFAAYRLVSRGRRPPRGQARPDRPAGTIVWFHACSAARSAVARDIAAKLRMQRSGVAAVLTLAGDGRTVDRDGMDWAEDLGADHPETAEAFLTHWQPDLCVWIGGRLLPNVILQARRRALPLILADTESADLPAPGGWRGRLARESLTAFDQVFAADDDAAARLGLLGVADGRITRGSPLMVSGTPLPVNEDAIADVTDLLVGRPVWLAAHLHPDEVGEVLAAQASAVRLSHRLLLVATPAWPDGAPGLIERARAMGLRTADWDAGEAPDDLTQVLVAPGGRHLGLWYRVAPVAFIGSSLVPGQGGRDPFDAAAMGSAVLYGPNVRDHLAAYSRLASAGAARIVKDAAGLSVGVMQTIAPDRAASMALAGWEIVSEGAGGADQLIDAIQDRLDRAGLG